jgi:hypothetical protein
MPIEIGSFSIGVVAGGIAVGIINHYLAKSRVIEDRAAKDFNAVADVLDKILTTERDSPSPRSNIDFYPFRRVLSKRDLISFDKCVEKYEKTKKDAVVDYTKSDEIICGGYPFYQDPTPIISEIDKLLKFTKRK